jgi:hypothetical protein
MLKSKKSQVCENNVSYVSIDGVEKIEDVLSREKWHTARQFHLHVSLSLNS